MPRRILVSGSSGLLGTALMGALADRWEVVPLVRGVGVKGVGTWDPANGQIELPQGIEAVVHLGGENLAEGRWTAAKKERIVSSRVGPTELLARTLAGLRDKPRVFLCASAIGFYGDRGAEVLTEESAAGVGFLPQTSQAWEAATAAAERAGIRTVHLRSGTVLARQGGALEKMLPPFRLGLGGRIGSGRQYMSWISLDDAIGAMVHLLEDSAARGAVNIVGPAPVTNQEFAQALGRAVHRPAVLPLPAFVARAALGELADALLLSGSRVLPKRLEAEGFRFRHPALEGALAAAITPS